MPKGRAKGSKVQSRLYTGSWRADAAGLSKLRAVCTELKMKQQDVIDLLVSAYLDGLSAKQMAAAVKPALAAKEAKETEAKIAALQKQLAELKGG